MDSNEFTERFTIYLYLVYGKVYHKSMDVPKLQAIIKKQLEEKYYTPKELQYGNEPGTYLSPWDYQKLLEYKETIASSSGPLILLPLPSFNSKCLYYSDCLDIEALLTNIESFADEGPDLLDRFSVDFMRSRIYSEIEGTLNIESVPITRKRLTELLEDGAKPQSKNDLIIKNMKAALDFVHGLPEFNKGNLRQLYTLLSQDCLDEEDQLRPNDCYRYDEVEIAQYHGCPAGQIERCMDALFEYVNTSIKANDKTTLMLLPHICHYYVLYVHPYFDYNGRTARMVSYWVHLLCGTSCFLPIVSEAINQTKNAYYKAIELSRDSHNDLTYFLKYVLGICVDYMVCFQNLNHFDQMAKNAGTVLTSTETHYMKRILICHKGAFTYADFLKMAHVSMSKQGALKILNRFVSYGFLKEVASSSKTKLFDIDKTHVPYAFKTLGFQG